MQHGISYLFSVLTLAAVSATALAIPPGATPPRPPNVVFILVDDLGWTDLGCYGSELYRTPNVDRLAREGMRFTQSYSACTVCSPTRAAIQTGRYPAYLHLTDWIAGHINPQARLRVPDWTMEMSPTNYTLARALHDAGYATAHIGKWHLGDNERAWPEHQGFDLNIGGTGFGAPQKKDGSNGYFSPYGNSRLPDGPNGEHLEERLAREACAFIEQHQHQPFYLNYCLYSVHTPLQAAPSKIERYRQFVRPGAPQHNPVYAAMVEHMDDAVGQILETLRRLGLEENTVVVFTSDNGGLIGNQGDTLLAPKVTSNSPLRTGKGDAYEGGIRVPLIVRYPGRIAHDTASDAPVISMDHYPTLLELAGIEVPAIKKVAYDGISLAGLLTGKTIALPPRDLFWHYPHYHIEGATPHGAIRSGDWKLLEFFEDDHVELYNLADDIGEQHDLAASVPQKVAELRSRLQAWRRQIGAQMPTPNPNFMPRQ